MKRQLVGAFFITGLLVGVLIAWQFKTDVPMATNFPSDEIEAKDTLIKSFMDEQSYLQSRIVTLRQDINGAQELVATQSEAASLALLEGLKIDVGLSEVVGEGIEIYLDDSPLANRDDVELTDTLLVQAADIRDLVNFLFSSNADAVSVNEQRIIATTPIYSVGASILINNTYLTPPFTIKAVGDKKLMAKRLRNKEAMPAFFDRIIAEQITFEAIPLNRLIIPMYNGDLRVDYLTLVD
ncbi:DUF881 domain-containing protein [Patescibacteria group bacterium]